MSREEKTERTEDCEGMVKTKRNERGQSVVVLTIEGVEMTAREVVEVYGVERSTVHRRLRKFGPRMTVDQLTKPLWDQKKREYPAGPNTREELERLAKIPGPTRWEYEARGLVPPAGVR
jgi:hypothetical protein